MVWNGFKKWNAKEEGPVSRDDFVDPLTGLWNAFRMEERISRERGKGYLIVLGINEFDHVINLFGYGAGGSLLKDVALELQDFLSDGEAAARWKGGLFLLLAEETNRRRMEERFNGLMQRLCALPIKLGVQHSEYPYTCTCGAVKSERNFSFEQLCEAADMTRKLQLLYGQENVCGFYSEEEERLKRYQRLRGDLDQAFQQGEFHPWLLPQRDPNTEEIVGGDVQLRWNHPELGWIPQEEFELLLQEEKRRTGVALMVLEEVCAQIKAWVEEDKLPAPLFLRLSEADLYSKEFLQQVRRLILRYQVPQSLLYLELPGGTIRKDWKYLRTLVEPLAEKGVKISLDQWENEGASLSAFWNIPVSAVKLDISKLRLGAGADWDEKRQLMFRRLAEVLSELDIRIICTQVNAKEQAEFIGKMNGYGISGTLFSKPMNIEEFSNEIFSE